VRAFLNTVAVGYNGMMVVVLYAGPIPPTTVALDFLVRLPEGLHWRQENDPSRARLPYGELRANSVAILERGNILSASTAFRRRQLRH
jgi:hypothetical protein